MKSHYVFSVVLPVAVISLSLSSAAKNVVQLKDAQGKSVGTAVIWENNPGVGMQLDLTNLPPGEHALHFHQNAKCDAPDFQHKFHPFRQYRRAWEHLLRAWPHGCDGTSTKLSCN